MITFTATTLSGVQQPQLSRSGLTQEGQHSDMSPTRNHPKNSSVRNTTLACCPCLHQTPSYWEWIPWGSPSPSTPGEHFPALEPSPERLALSLPALSHRQLSHTSYSSHSGDAMDKATPSPLSPSVTAGSSHSPERLLVVVLRGWEAHWTRHSGSHEVVTKPSIWTARIKESIRGSFIRGDKRLIEDKRG